jgi:hypothetical protein
LIIGEFKYSFQAAKKRLVHKFAGAVEEKGTTSCDLNGGEGEDTSEYSPTEEEEIQLRCSLSGRKSWRCWRIG